MAKVNKVTASGTTYELQDFELTKVSGIVKSSSGTLTAAVAGTDYATPSSVNNKVDKTTTVNGKALSSNITLSSSDIKMSDNTTIEASMTSLKTSVSEGKSLIAAAVTDKGVQTAANASFATMANNIASIQSGMSSDEILGELCKNNFAITGAFNGRYSGFSIRYVCTKSYNIPTSFDVYLTYWGNGSGSKGGKSASWSTYCFSYVSVPNLQYIDESLNVIVKRKTVERVDYSSSSLQDTITLIEDEINTVINFHPEIISLSNDYHECYINCYNSDLILDPAGNNLDNMSCLVIPKYDGELPPYITFYVWGFRYYCAPNTTWENGAWLVGASLMIDENGFVVEEGYNEEWGETVYIHLMCNGSYVKGTDVIIDGASYYGESTE